MFGFAEPWVTYIKLGIGFLAGAVVAGAIAYEWGHLKGDSAGYARYAAEQSAADLKAEKERKRNDAHIQGLTDYDFCVESLTRRRMPVDACESLRRIPTK